ncbi:MAG TPA: hypothetical protein VEK08_01115 [Planctomycetota bacterium]|nr:hypothetical protein [Planctomycetota bacterium]
MPVETEDRDLLVGLIYGVLHEQEPVSGAEFAAKIAVCARLTNGDQDLYTKAVKKALVNESNLTELFPRTETEQAIRSFMRAIRKARNDSETLIWLGQQFEQPQTEQVVKEYLVSVERALAKNFISR